MFPQGTVFVVVIDPTVGTSRKAIVAKSKKGNYYVLPDNGLLTYVQDHEGIEAARVITNPKWMLGDAISSTFHGRDIFRPSARTWRAARTGPTLARKCRSATWGVCR